MRHFFSREKSSVPFCQFFSTQAMSHLSRAEHTCKNYLAFGDSLPGLRIRILISIILRGRIRIRIRMKREIRFRIKVMRNYGGPWTLTLESYWVKMKPWRVYRPLFADSNHFDVEKDTDPDPH
jgi:hypothetical protein